jgi:hypothetical protein
MSMHATLGIRLTDNTILGCYVHMDGSTMENRIRLFVDQYTTTGLAVLISEAQSKGGMRSFHIPNVTIPEDPAARETEMLDDEPYVIDEKSWMEDHMGTCCRYLVDYQTGEITVKKMY